MQIIQNEIQKIKLNLPLKSSLVVVGYFDGLHAYHQKLLNLGQKLATSQNLNFILVTFNQKVADYFHKTNHDLISHEVKFDFLKTNYQLDFLIELKVNQNLVNYSKQKFLDFLEQNLGTKMMVEGQDFSFAAQCTGKVADLSKRFGAQEVVVLKRKKAVSTTKIRQWLSKGKILKVNFWLHRHLELSLLVEKSETKSANYQLVYPKSKLRAGAYEIFDDSHHHLIIEIDEKQKVKIIKDFDNLLTQNKVYQLQFKKFLGAKK